MMNFLFELSSEFNLITDSAVVAEPEKKSSTKSFLSNTVLSNSLISFVGLGVENGTFSSSTSNISAISFSFILSLLISSSF